MRPVIALVALLVLCASLAACSNGIAFKAKGQMQTGVSVSGHR